MLVVAFVPADVGPGAILLILFCAVLVLWACFGLPDNGDGDGNPPTTPPS